jgi:hypothetical protein
LAFLAPAPHFLFLEYMCGSVFHLTGHSSFSVVLIDPVGPLLLTGHKPDGVQTSHLSLAQADLPACK